tara:strand:+ start:1133 stop:1465 length:333 start_codon:yes stop_codon:yes gene_type:complete
MGRQEEVATPDMRLWPITAVGVILGLAARYHLSWEIDNFVVWCVYGQDLYGEGLRIVDRKHGVLSNGDELAWYSEVLRLTAWVGFVALVTMPFILLRLVLLKRLPDSTSS